jgi:hypothetical protein
MTSREQIESRLLYKVVVGSRAYGMEMPDSDTDYAGIFVPPEEYFFGLQAFDLLNEQKDNDLQYYSLRKFASLAVANNPNVLELLFVDNRDILTITSGFADGFWKHRQKFLSQRCLKSYLGYAGAQLHRIRNHARWLTQELKAMEVLWPLVMGRHISREWVAWRFGTNLGERIEQELDQKQKEALESGNQDAVNQMFGLVGWDWKNKKKAPEMDDYLVQLVGTGLLHPMEGDGCFYRKKGMDVYIFDEMAFKEAKKKRQQYTEWMACRNPVRHETELKFGFDLKHAAHLVRLLRTGYEILTTGDLLVRRPDAEELKSIRQGAWSYEKIIAYADEMIIKVQELKEFAVPEQPDVKFINDLLIATTREALGLYYPEVWT